MSEKINRQFGVWMDNHQATIVGYEPSAAKFSVLAHAKSPKQGSNSNENTANNLEIALVRKFFKEIGSHMENAEAIHITGTGTVQEQFVRYLGETSQFKKTTVSESTSNPMSDEKLVEFVGRHFN